MTRSRDTAAALAVLLLTAVAKLWLAGRWDLLADEAYYAAWSEQLALGYHDQPPAVAWAVGAGRALLGDTELAVRLHAPLAGLLGGVALLPHARDRLLLAVWWAAVPPLAWLTGFGTPDALLLGCWAGALGAGLRGGPWWLLAGALAALGVWAKYPALAVYPLLMVGARAWGDRWAWAGAGLLVALVAPHAGWLLANQGVSVGFQLREGLLHPSAPGLWGPPLAVAQQLGVLTPFVALAVGALWVGPRQDRVARVAWWTSAPLCAFFLLASLGGPPEAHWMAPAWIGAGLGLANAGARALRLAWFGCGVGLLASAGLVLHAEVGLARLPMDPAHRLHEGRAVAEIAAAWALPDGVGWREPGVERALPVRTERYQEAALIWWYTGLDARKQPGCGRVDQYDRWGAPAADRVLFIRPSRSGLTLCTDGLWTDKALRQRAVGEGPRAEVVGRWDVFELSR